MGLIILTLLGLKYFARVGQISVAFPVVFIFDENKRNPHFYQSVSFSALELPFYAQSPSHREFAVKNFLFIVLVVLLYIKNKKNPCNSLQIKEE